MDGIKKQVMLSVGILTYNHAKYIRQALDGVVMQKTNFRFEVIVADDASTDGTQGILKEYAKKYPDLFRLVLRESNLGPSRNNYELKFETCGKYYACLEGDDYWTDENKLQTQVDFLESHEEYIACVHKCTFVDENGSPLASQPLNGYYYNDEIYTIRQFEEGILPGQTATLMYRNIFLDRSKDFSILYKANPRIADKTAILLLLSYGNIYNMDKTMSSYRYIICPEGTNISSNYIGKNNRDELMQYLTVLENYAEKELSFSLNMEKKKRNYFAAAVTIWLKSPTKANQKVIRNMLKLSNNKMKYCCLMIKIILTKSVGWHLLGKDIRIKV